MIAGMPEHVTTVRIRAPLATVYRAFSDPSEAAKCLSSVRRVERLEPVPPALHPVYREWRVLRDGREVVQDLEVVEAVPHTRCRLVTTTAGIRSTFTASFEEKSGETTVAIRAHVQGVTVLAKLLLPLLWILTRGAAKKELAADLEELRTCLERSASE
jgi:uncharacterized protein YndB with AHSA1/START domain